jgi:hypothetical protein
MSSVKAVVNHRRGTLTWDYDEEEFRVYILTPHEE